NGCERQATHCAAATPFRGWIPTGYESLSVIRRPVAACWQHCPKSWKGTEVRYPGWVEPAGMVVGYAADAVFGDPRRAHPVAAFGQLAAALEHVVWADSRARGVSYAVTCVAGACATGTALRRSTAADGAARFAVTAASTWAVLGLRGLTGEGATMRALLDSEDLSGARTRLAHLCARDADS